MCQTFKLRHIQMASEYGNTKLLPDSVYLLEVDIYSIYEIHEMLREYKFCFFPHIAYLGE